MGASGILIYLRGLHSMGSRSTRRERKASRVIGVATGMALAFTLGVGSSLSDIVWMVVDLLILLVTIGWVWRILATPATRR